MSQLEPASWLTECMKAASFPKLQPFSDRTKPTFEKKGTQPEALSTLTETSYMVVQTKQRKEKRRRTKGGGEQSRESTWEKIKQEGGKVERIKDKESRRSTKQQREGGDAKGGSSIPRKGCRADRRSKQASQSPHSQSQDQSQTSMKDKKEENKNIYWLKDTEKKD